MVLLIITHVQWNLSNADTYGTEVFVRFREDPDDLDPLSHGLLLPLI